MTLPKVFCSDSNIQIEFSLHKNYNATLFQTDWHKEYIIQPNEQGMTMKFSHRSIVSE